MGDEGRIYFKGITAMPITFFVSNIFSIIRMGIIDAYMLNLVENSSARKNDVLLKL